MRLDQIDQTLFQSILILVSTKLGNKKGLKIKENMNCNLAQAAVIF